MKIDRLVLGDYETNCYIVRSDNAVRECLIIDPGLQPGPLVDLLESNHLNPCAVILTHGHADHIAGLPTIRSKYPDVAVYIHKNDAQLLGKPQANLSILTGQFLRIAPADHLLEEGDLIDEAGIQLKVIHTPGHTSGGICLYAENENILFVGDSLFANSVGRTDFPGGNMQQLISGIKEKICTLPDDTTVYPTDPPQQSALKKNTTSTSYNSKPSSLKSSWYYFQPMPGWNLLRSHPKDALRLPPISTEHPK